MVLTVFLGSDVPSVCRDGPLAPQHLGCVPWKAIHLLLTTYANQKKKKSKIKASMQPRYVWLFSILESLSVCVSVCFFLCVSVCLSLLLSLSFSLSVRLSASPVCLSVCLSVSACLSCLSVCPSVCLSICLFVSVCLSLSTLSTCLSIYRRKERTERREKREKRKNIWHLSLSCPSLSTSLFSLLSLFLSLSLSPARTRAHPPTRTMRAQRDTCAQVYIRVNAHLHIYAPLTLGSFGLVGTVVNTITDTTTCNVSIAKVGMV